MRRGEEKEASRKSGGKSEEEKGENRERRPCFLFCRTDDLLPANPGSGWRLVRIAHAASAAAPQTIRPATRSAVTPRASWTYRGVRAQTPRAVLRGFLIANNAPFCPVHGRKSAKGATPHWIFLTRADREGNPVPGPLQEEKGNGGHVPNVTCPRRRMMCRRICPRASRAP